MKKHFPFLVLLFASMVLYGQGTVRGVITGSDENDPLIAATVFVKGTTTGTVTDYNGEYVLVLKAGAYTLQVSYIGYETAEETITLENSQTLEMNTTLILVSIRGEEAVVTAQARGQLAAVNQQLRSNKIVNVVSSERIKELPDQNAAQAVSRLPGIHLDGSKIVIRGIQPKMNKILINGVEMPSTEANSRATSIGMISANMLSGIEVYKTLTPDMDADAIGGVVNLTLREAPKGLHYNAMVQGTYNAQERFMGNFRVWGDVSNRFFNDKFGVSLSMNYDKSRGGSDEVSSEYIRLSEATLGTADYIIDVFTVSDAVSASESFGGSLILDYKLPKGKLIFTNMINHTEPDNLTYIDDYSLGQFRRHILLEHSRHKSLLLNNSLQYEQQIGIAKLDASVSYISIKREDVFSYSYEFGTAESTLLTDSLTNARRLVMEPWEIYGAEVPDSWKKLLMGNFFWDPETYGENQVIANLNLEVPFRITDQISATLKTGGKYRRMDREFDNSRSQYGGEINRTLVQSDMQEFLASMGHDNVGAALKITDFRDYDYQPNGEFLNNDPHYHLYALNVDYMDHMALDLMDYDKLLVQPASWTQDYWGGEELFAGYLMTEINLWNRLLIIAGARYESLQKNYTAMEVASISTNTYSIEDTISRLVTQENLLPHLHLRLRVTDWWDIRFSYNQTLSRPDYNHGIPSVFYDQIAGTGKAGSPTIGPALSKNLDANFTFYSRKLGLVTVGGFMKTIEDMFYAQPTQIANIPDTLVRNRFPTDKFQTLAQGMTDYYINNPNPAYLKGVEVEWQSNLTYLPVPFNGLVFNVNYTHIWSKTNYVQHRVDNVWKPEFPFFDLVENDTVFSERLLHQANDIANVSLGYDYKGFSARVSFRFQGNVISNIGGREEDNNYTNDVYKIDFVMKQRIPIKSANFEIFFNVINLTNTPYRQYSIYPNKGQTNRVTRYSGSRFQLGIRLTK